SRWLALIGVLGVGLMFHFLEQRVEAAGAWLSAETDEFKVGALPITLERVRAASPFGLPLRYAQYREASTRIERARARLANFTFGLPHPVASPGRQIFVLVIGESSRFDRWGVNGYSHPTSPRLAAEPHLVTLSDVVSVAALTRMSVPVILTRKPAALAQ